MLPGKPQWVAHGAGKNYKVIFYRVCSEAEGIAPVETALLSDAALRNAYAYS
jgi:hypothetical protein